MQIKSKFEENSEIELLTRPFVAIHKLSGNVYLFQKASRIDNENNAILIASGKYTASSLEVGQETETTLSKYPNDWRVVLNPTITVTEG